MRVSQAWRAAALSAVCGASMAGVVAAQPSAATTAASGEMPSFDVSALDRSTDPCNDFFQFACGGWMAKNPIPPDQSRWGRFDELADRNRDTLRTILEQVAAPDPKRSPIERQIGDAYAACMDEAAVDKLGATPVRPVLAQVEALAGLDGLPALLAALHAQDVAALFNFGSFQDFKDATRNIAALDQGGLGLPDRDFYLKDDAASVKIRQQYREHMRNMFGLLGDAPAEADRQAERVLQLETELAKVSMERVKRRDPANVYNKMRRTELHALTPAFGWERYFEAAGTPAFAEINVVSLPYAKGLQGIFKTAELASWKAYLRWHVLRNAAPSLSTPFAQESFEFYGRALTGAKELRPRWKRCVQAVDEDLGEALGQLYVARTFGADGKQRMLVLVAALEHALERNIRDLPWMTAVTKQKALEKLALISNKIGYPDQWRDYSAIAIRRDDLLGNRVRAGGFEFARDVAKIGTPVDRKEWVMSPPTVNAYYEPGTNSINFPAGILRPPFFDRNADDAVNFGGIGSVIGHELTHGFDDQGRRFAGDGNLSDWWSEADATEFQKRAQCLVEQYGGYTAVDDVKLNGQLTLGENVADNGGLRIAYMALLDTLAGRKVAPIDGFTPEQRLFLGWGQIWCQNVTAQTARLRAQTDTHSPGRFRVNGTLANMPEFRSAFQCKPDAPMVRASACRVW